MRKITGAQRGMRQVKTNWDTKRVEESRQEHKEMQSKVKRGGIG